MHKLFFIFLMFCLFSPELLEAQAELTPTGGYLEGAVSISVIPSGQIYLVEQNRHRFLVLTKNGIRVDSLGSQGSGDYRFAQPASIDATNGLKIYVADKNNSRVQIYDRRFQYLSSVTEEKLDNHTRFSPVQLAVSSSNELFVYDDSEYVVHKFDSNGNYEISIDLQRYRIRHVTQMKMAGTMLLLLDSRQGVLHRFQADGGYLNFIGGFDRSLAIHGSENHIWAAFNDRIVQYSHQGAELQTIRLERSYPFTDLSVSDNIAYLLTPPRLYKTSL